MNPRSERRKHPRRKSFQSQDELRIQPLNGSMGAPLGAVLLDISEWGLSVETGVPLETGTILRVSGKIHNIVGRKPLENTYRVCWCSATQAASWRVGLAPETPAQQPPRAEVHESTGEFVDCYEALQLSPRADAETIHRVFRALAQRFHPDNQETGDQELFRQALNAYRTLSDPEQRAAHDARLQYTRQSRLKIFEHWQSARGGEAEKRKRQSILAALYSQRFTDSRQPSLSLRELEELVNCPGEHLEFSLWYMRESGWLVRGDNTRFTITAKGVDVVEAMESPAHEVVKPRLSLPA
jgi:hypothetical protein